MLTMNGSTKFIHRIVFDVYVNMASSLQSPTCLVLRDGHRGDKAAHADSSGQHAANFEEMHGENVS